MSSSDSKNNGDPLSVLKVLDHDLDVYFSSEEAYNNLRVSSSLNNIVGRIVTVEAPRPVGKNPDGSDKFVLNFELEIKAKRKKDAPKNASPSYVRIRISVWDDEVQRLKDHVKNNKVVFIENIYASRCLEHKRQYNNNREFNLSCQSQTIMYDLKALNNIPEFIGLDIDALTKYCDIQTALSETEDFEQIVGLKNVYLKSGFTPDAMGIKSAVVSDGTIAMRIKIINFKDDRKIEQGQYLEIFGQFYMDDERILFRIKDMDHIVSIDTPRVPKMELLKSMESPKKKARLNN